MVESLVSCQEVSVSGGSRDAWEIPVFEPFAIAPEAGGGGLYPGGRAWGRGV